jgi:hypothetical protein
MSIRCIFKSNPKILEAFWKHSGSILEAFWKHSGSIKLPIKRNKLQAG